jgi:hypothetical protein
VGSILETVQSCLGKTSLAPLLFSPSEESTCSANASRLLVYQFFDNQLDFASISTTEHHSPNERAEHKVWVQRVNEIRAELYTLMERTAA